MTRVEVARAIESFLDHGDSPWDWDDFTSVRIGDPDLDAIRARCAQLDREFPPDEPGQYCGPDGVAVLRGLIRELRAIDG
jgi:hypothetical protein